MAANAQGGSRRPSSGGRSDGGRQGGGAPRGERDQRPARIDPARRAAYDVTYAVETEDGYANLLMPGILKQHRLSGRDAGFATELAYGALRGRGLYDAIIADAAKRRTDTLDIDLVVALRLGVHQALAMRVPAHAAVSETVDLVRSVNGRAAGLANAVMRRVTERDLDTWLARVAPGTSRESQAIRHSHPAWVVGELEHALTADGRPGELTQLLEADNAPASVTLVARPGLIDRDALLEQADGAATVYSPLGVSLSGGAPGDIEAVGEGTAAVQDEGSQIAALALVHADAAIPGRADAGVGSRIDPGERWLDMCAGPGGKAALLAAAASEGMASLEALELHEHRAALVRRSLKAIPEGVATVHRADARTWEPSEPYDRILLDAPCTGLGALRRRPEARWRRSIDDLDDLVDLQHALIAHAGSLLAEGGVLAYVTCSPVLAETLDVVRDSGLAVLDTRLAVASATGTQPTEWGHGPHVQLWPHAHGTDAMFIQLLTRA
ncbi:RsmB/NOP family class I SAM-dependent RNA methyltransferase [Demequina sp. NBRC 110055]|uniref:RsmB/NOP family class I SAM-dependent RNA methyltransferase n=1 Tax=Demequina sp. NBRC 110055 TaxID=1570344 RepID=UPI0009FEBCA3|nr:transcription antitermination factor NusB [Demequina sp. NBRC 110055]